MIYGNASENPRAINVFDGLQYFRGSAVTLTPDGFRVPASPVNGTPARGLGFNYAAHVSYSSQAGGGASFNYTPVPDAAGSPSFTIRFRVHIP